MKQILLKVITFIVLTIGFNLSGNSVHSQNLDTISIEYNNWLTKIGLNKIFKVYLLEKQNDTLILYLAFVCSDRDSVSQIWKTANIAFQNEYKSTLIDALFKNFIFVSENNIQVLNIQLYDTYDLKLAPCFYYKLYWDKANRKVIADSSICKSKEANFLVEIDLKKNKQYIKISESNQLDVKRTKKEIYSKILLASEKYFKTRCKNFERDFEKSHIDPNRPLKFQVSGLKQEVLYHKDNHWFCEIFSLFTKTDCRINEYLFFTFDCNITNDEITISVSVEGKFGAYDNYNPDTYSNMEPDFSYFLQKYTDNYLNNRIYPLFQ